MIDHLAQHIAQKVNEVAELYYRLILLVVEPTAITPTAPDYPQLAARLQTTALNLNLELSSQMLPLTTRQRALKVHSIMASLVDALPQEPLLLTHTHILFEPTLRQDPLKLLQTLSRRKTIIAVWEGQVEDRYLTYARPDHPEHRHYSTSDLVLLDFASSNL